MKNFPDLIYAVWDSQVNFIAAKSKPLEKVNFDDFISSAFCTTAYYYYVVDFPNRKMDLVSHHVKELLGIEPADYSLETMLGNIHPEDIQFVVQCEQKVADFILNKIRPEQIVKYKMSYSFRLKTMDGEYKLFFHQALALSTNENGELDKVMGIHSDISHLCQDNNYKISFVGLQGEPSFFEMDVFSEDMFQNAASTNPFTKRELEILRLIGRGNTAKKIAGLLYISEETVKTHRKNMLRKAGLIKITELVALCIKKGFI